MACVHIYPMSLFIPHDYILEDIASKICPVCYTQMPCLDMVIGHDTTRPQRGIEFSDRTNIANIELLVAHFDNQ